MCGKRRQCQGNRKVFRLIFWRKAKGDIYRVHNSYSFIMIQICKKFQNIIIFFSFSDNQHVLTLVDQLTQYFYV